MPGHQAVTIVRNNPAQPRSFRMPLYGSPDALLYVFYIR